MMTGLDWIAFNVERAMDLRNADPERADTAQRILPPLLQALPDKVDLALNSGEALST